MKLDLTMKKIFSLAIVGISFFLIVFSFLPYIGSGSIHYSLWSKVVGYGTATVGIFQCILLLGVMAVYLLHVFKGLKEKWISYANYAVGFVTFTQITYFFRILDGGSMVGFWFEFLLALGLAVCSVLWYFQKDEPISINKAPIIGYDEQTGKPIYAKIKSYDPKTGKPIYEKN